jgi:membrane protein required for colicin V production
LKVLHPKRQIPFRNFIERRRWNHKFASAHNFSKFEKKWVLRWSSNFEKRALAMNTFDIVVLVATMAAAASGFKAGLLRSAATILAYLIAMPTAVFLTSFVAADGSARFGASLAERSPVLFGIFLITGIVLAKSMRIALGDAVGNEPGIGDRLAGAALGMARAGLVAVTFVLSFDQLAPMGRQPSYLAGSQLRPLLSQAGERGLMSLPPDVVTYIDRLKSSRRI